MRLDPALCYRAVLARDARYDGQFFTCVKTTGIYCRPICPARPPKLENCVFVPTAAAAQEAGFRPCLRCRPESSPDLGAWKGTSATVSRALALIEGGALDDDRVDALANRLGLGERQLRRLFKKHLGASPIAVAQTRRILLAKQLIHETDLSLTEIALASGFGSVRRFNETFQDLYHRPPGALRRARAGTSGAAISLLLPYRPPYDWEAMLGFLGRRAIAGIESVTDGVYRRTIEIGEASGWIEVKHAPEKSALRIKVHFTRLSALPTIIARIRRIFDLGADPAVIAKELSRDPVLAPLVAERPGLRVPGAWDGFEIAVRAILGQQISVEAARRLAGALAKACGNPVPGTQTIGLLYAFPQPPAVSDTALATLGMPRARMATILSLARAAQAHHLFDPPRDLESAVARLTELPGIGEWTAHYIALRALNQSDAFPASDLGLLRAFASRAGRRATPAELIARAENWRPWRAYAALHLWTADSAEPQKEIIHALAI
ncbi:MAG TPA: AlkA N-terminal domain-containing protein [Methylovirgula sp.]|nr:AlkA N-terminal domain-containing protein [Methylovirgula sp.]